MIRSLAMLIAVVDLMIGSGVGYAWARKAPASAPPEMTVAQRLTTTRAALTPEQLERLRGWLTADVEKALAERAAAGKPPVRLTVTLIDARPSGPVDPAARGRSLSRRGGATISAALVREDGSITPLVYKAYRRPGLATPGSDTWQDARAAFQVFADMIAADRFGRCVGAACKALRVWHG